MPMPFRRLAPAVAAFALFGAAALPVPSPEETGAILDKVAARLESFNPKGSWTASILSTQIEHDHNWRPKRTTVQNKVVTVTEGRREENTLKVVRTEDGKTEDITEEFLVWRRKQWEKYHAGREAEERRQPSSERRSLRRIRLEHFSELLPFSAGRREEFAFDVREGTGADGRPVYLCDVRAKIKDTINWEGTYTIDAETYTPVHARLRPSDLPSFVKEIEVEAEFGVFEDVNFIPLRTWVRVNAGFLFIKRYRVISEEFYSDIRVTH